jgi:D-glycero-alpha-D-manno-heptose-7-phosphate kinase
MIVTRTPFRVTLGGGGTDLPSFYQQHGGFIFGMGIDKYMYIMLNPPIVDSRIRLHYSRSETVDHVSELQHELAREALRLNGVESRIEISSMADLPDGTGLGSSGAYLVGLLTALHQFRRDYVSLATIAEEACRIELDVLGKAVGKQDQYMAAFGGMTVLDIQQDGRVDVRGVDVSSASLETFIANTHLYYTGQRRSAVDVLQEQDVALRETAAPNRGRVTDALLQIRDLGYRILDAVEREDYDAWGRLLDEHWQHKKRMSARISLAPVDALYDRVRSEFGVLGGKIVGAGGGGFLMLYAPSRHRELETFMLTQGMPRLHYKIESAGTKVIADHANGRPLPNPVRSAPSR